jgi:hypothetical protein
MLFPRHCVVLSFGTVDVNPHLVHHLADSLAAFRRQVTPLGGERKFRTIEPAATPMLDACDLATVDAADDAGHSRSPGDRSRWALRARASAVVAAYRWTIARDCQPVRRMRSPSLPPPASHWWAKV